jgi:hypothetical protein
MSKDYAHSHKSRKAQRRFFTLKIEILVKGFFLCIFSSITYGIGYSANQNFALLSVQAKMIRAFLRKSSYFFRKRFCFSQLFCCHPSSSSTAPTKLQRRGTFSSEPRSRLAREANETDKGEAEEEGEEEEGEEEKDTARSVIFLRAWTSTQGRRERERESFKYSSSFMFIYCYYLGGVVYRELAWK